MRTNSNEITLFGNEITQNKSGVITNNDYIHAATSDNTRKAYRSDIKHFLSCNGLLPTTTETIIHYLHENASMLNSRTLERRLAALRQWHLTQGYVDPTQHPSVAKTLKGIKRIHGKPKKKAPGLLLNDLINISDQLNQSGTLKDIRNNALLLVQFAGAFRVSELVNIQYEHLSFNSEGVEIIIPRSKTDQENRGKNIFIPYTNQSLCPVSSLKKWLDSAHIKTGYIFKRISKNSMIQNKPLSTRTINYIIENVTNVLQQPDSPQKKYSSHSLRRGFATEAARKNASLASIMRQGRWKSINTVLDYTEDSNSVKDNAISVIFDKTINR